MLATVTGIAVRDGLIKDVDAAVGSQIKDGGYDSPQNAKVTWRHHLQQETEWEGEMWGKKHDFVGTVAFGDGERKPRALQAPGTFYEYNDVRINRFALSLLRAVQEAGAGCVSRRSHERDRRLEHLAVDSVQQQLRRCRRKEACRRSAAARAGAAACGSARWTWRASAICGCATAVGVTSRSFHPPTSSRHSTASTNGPDYGFLWWLNTKGSTKTLTDQFVPGAGCRQQHDLRLA